MEIDGLEQREAQYVIAAALDGRIGKMRTARVNHQMYGLPQEVEDGIDRPLIVRDRIFPLDRPRLAVAATEQIEAQRSIFFS